MRCYIKREIKFSATLRSHLWPAVANVARTSITQNDWRATAALGFPLSSEGRRLCRARQPGSLTIGPIVRRIRREILKLIVAIVLNHLRVRDLLRISVHAARWKVCGIMAHSHQATESSTYGRHRLR